jgi:hypothetical protein
VVKPPRSTDMAEAPADQGAKRENIGHIRPMSNAERRDASAVECRGGFTTDCQAGPFGSDVTLWPEIK